MLTRSILVAAALVATTVIAFAPEPVSWHCHAPKAGFPCNIDAATTGNGNEVHIAANPLDPQNFLLAAKDYSLPGTDCGVKRMWAGFYVTFDGGETWQNGLLPGHNGGAGTGPLATYKCLTDPVVAFGPDGTAWYSGLMTSPQRGVFVARSTDGGATWKPEDIRIVAIEDQPDKNWLAVDPVAKHVYVTWTHFGANMHVHMRRMIGGNLDSWDPMVNVCAPQCVGKDGTFVAASGTGEVYVLFTDVVSGGQGHIWLNRLTGYGTVLGAPKKIQPITALAEFVQEPWRVPTFPQIAVSTCSCATKGRVAVVWQDGSSGKGDVSAIFSDDKGETWSQPARVSDDATNAAQYFPALTIDPLTGYALVAFYDRRIDDPEVAGVVNVFASWTPDGTTWSKNRRVTTVSSNPVFSKNQKGDVFMGDYIGIATAGWRTYPAWTDTRNGLPEPFMAEVQHFPIKKIDLSKFIYKKPIWIPIWIHAPSRLAHASLQVEIPQGLAVLDAPEGDYVPNPNGTTLVVWSLRDQAGEIGRGLTLQPTKSGTYMIRTTLAATLGNGESETATEEHPVEASFPAPDLAVEGASFTTAGSLETLTLRLTNGAGGLVKGAKVRLTLPPDVLLVPTGVATGPGNAPGPGYGSPPAERVTMTAFGTYHWEVGDLPANATRTVAVRYAAPPRAAPATPSSVVVEALATGISEENEVLSRLVVFTQEVAQPTHAVPRHAPLPAPRVHA